MNQMSLSGPLGQFEYHSGRSILIFSDDPARLDWIERLVTYEGGRVSAALPLGEAVRRIADHASPEGVIADLASASVTAAEAIFDALESGASAYRFPSVALIHAGMIDLAVTRASHADVELLCAPEDRDLALAVRRLLAPRVPALKDVGTEHHTARLRELSDEVSRIAHALATLSDRHRDGHATRGEQAELPTDARVIRALIRARRMREQFFPADLFADPAWDMLLDLTAARLEGRPVAVSSLCIAAAVPPTTALRWIKALTDLGMFVRVADPSDRRRVFIELAPEVAETMLECLAATRQTAWASV